MQGWSLEDVRNLSVTDYDELVLWLREEADRSKSEPGSIDMDQMLAARRAMEGD